MELNITAFVNANADQMELYSDSVANSGLDNIGQLTWRNALLEAKAHPEFFAGVDHDELIEHFAGYGAWEREELESQSDAERIALLIQFIAGDYQRLDEGEESGALYQSDDGQFFYYIGL